MFGLGPATKVYLALGATDMRKGFDGLYGLVRDRLMCEPTSGHRLGRKSGARAELDRRHFEGSPLPRGGTFHRRLNKG